MNSKKIKGILLLALFMLCGTRVLADESSLAPDAVYNPYELTDSGVAALTDGDSSTMWEYDSYPAVVIMDFGAISRISKVEIDWLTAEDSHRVYTYSIQVSDDGNSFLEVSDRWRYEESELSSDYPGEDTYMTQDTWENGVVGRYLRLEVKGSYLNTANPAIREIRINGERTRLVNLARTAKVTATGNSVGIYDVATNGIIPIKRINDGNFSYNTTGQYNIGGLMLTTKQIKPFFGFDFEFDSEYEITDVFIKWFDGQKQFEQAYGYRLESNGEKLVQSLCSVTDSGYSVPGTVTKVNRTFCLAHADISSIFRCGGYLTHNSVNVTSSKISLTVLQTANTYSCGIYEVVIYGQPKQDYTRIDSQYCAGHLSDVQLAPADSAGVWKIDNSANGKTLLWESVSAMKPVSGGIYSLGDARYFSTAGKVVDLKDSIEFDAEADEEIRMLLFAEKDVGAFQMCVDTDDGLEFETIDWLYFDDRTITGSSNNGMFFLSADDSKRKGGYCAYQQTEYGMRAVSVRIDGFTTSERNIAQLTFRAAEAGTHTISFDSVKCIGTNLEPCAEVYGILVGRS